MNCVKSAPIATVSRSNCSCFTALRCFNTGPYLIAMFSSVWPIRHLLYLHHNAQRIPASMIISHNSHDLIAGDFGISEMDWNC